MLFISLIAFDFDGCNKLSRKCNVRPRKAWRSKWAGPSRAQPWSASVLLLCATASSSRSLSASSSSSCVGQKYEWSGPNLTSSSCVWLLHNNIIPSRFDWSCPVTDSSVPSALQYLIYNLLFRQKIQFAEAAACQWQWKIEERPLPRERLFSNVKPWPVLKK